MDGYKPDDDLKSDPSDRPSGRSRQNANYDNEPRINIDDVDVDADERRPSRANRAREQEKYAVQDDENRPRRRRPAPAGKASVSRQHIMLGVGILVLLLIIFGIGSALKGPSSSATPDANTASGERNIDLSGNGQQSAGANAPSDATAQTSSDPRDISLPPISSTPTQSQPTEGQNGQQRMEIQGDLNNALTPPQGQQSGQGQMGNTASSTLPTQPATVAMTGNGGVRAPQQTTSPAQVSEPRRPQRQTTIIEPPHKPQPTRPQVTAQVKSEPKPAVKAPAQTASTPTKAPAATTSAPKAAESKPAATAAPTATTASSSAKASTGNVGALTSASPSHYTLQLSSSSNYANLNAWAKKENLQDYVVYQTQREGKPWYVLVKGVYTSKDEAKRAVSSLPAEVQAKNPWTKPISQVQTDLKS